ncbi:MAG: hypothetical protein ACJ72M_23575 [Propionibacteriaceae bacterium]
MPSFFGITACLTGDGWKVPSRRVAPGTLVEVLALHAGVAFLALLAELAVAEWGAVYLRDNLGSTASVAAYGYACFSLTVVASRFLADRITARLGYLRMLRWGGLAAGTALAIGLLTNTVAGSVIGWGVAGIGMAAVVPIVFTMSGNLPGVPTGAALSKSPASGISAA